MLHLITRAEYVFILLATAKMETCKYLFFLSNFLILHAPCNGDINIVQSTDLDRPLLSVEHGWDDVTPNFWLPDELTLTMVDSNSDSCSANLAHPPKNVDNNARKWILLTSDLNCAVDDIIVNAMRRRYKAVVIYPFGSDRDNTLKVSPSLKAQLTDINVYFVDERMGKRLRKFAFPFKTEETFFVRFGRMKAQASGGYRKPNFEQPTSTENREDDITKAIILRPMVFIFCATIIWMYYSARPSPPPSSPPKTPPKSPPPSSRYREPSPPKQQEVAEVEPSFLESFILLDVNFTTDPERVRHAWRTKCRQFHPDQNLGQPQDIIDQRAKMFRRLTRAKEKVLNYLENRGK